MNINGLILAAGRGSRMKDETTDKPKCMVKLAGKPLLHWQLDALRAGGVSNITVARGYLAKMLQGDFKTVNNPDWATSNMVSTFLCAYPAIKGSPCIVSYSDIVYHSEHIKKLSKTKADIAITYDTEWESLWKLRFKNPLDDAETFIEQNGVLQSIGDKADSISEIKGQFMGLLYFSPLGLKTVYDFLESTPKTETDQLDMTALLRKMLTKKITIAAVPVSGKWCEADSMDDIKSYEQTLDYFQTNNKVWSHDWRS